MLSVRDPYFQVSWECDPSTGLSVPDFKSTPSMKVTSPTRVSPGQENLTIISLAFLISLESIRPQCWPPSVKRPVRLVVDVSYRLVLDSGNSAKEPIAPDRIFGGWEGPIYIVLDIHCSF